LETKAILKPRLADIEIRTQWQPADLEAIARMHVSLYASEHGYGPQFETYVVQGLNEFSEAYDEGQDRAWLCEHGGRLVGSILLMHRGNQVAQLRYFLIRPQFRGIGLGKRLLDLWMQCLRERGYTSAYLWTVDNLHVAAALYRGYGFTLTEEKRSTTFGKEVCEQRYDLAMRGE
jgi:peptidyl-dipeptidase Dcp